MRRAQRPGSRCCSWCGHVTLLFRAFRQSSLDERFFRQHGIERRLQVMSPDVELMIHTSVGTDPVATMPSRLTRICAGHHPITLLEPPMAVPSQPARAMRPD